MSHEGAPTGGEELEQQSVTSESYYGGEVPEFNPDHAEELKQEAAVETDSTQAEAETQSEAGPSLKYDTDRLNLNRDIYNDVMKHYAFLESQYPQDQPAPDSIRDEKANSRLMMQLLVTPVEATREAVFADGIGEHKVSVESSQKGRYEEVAGRLASLAAKNQALLDTEAEKNFQLPGVNLESIAQQIDAATNLEELEKVKREIQSLTFKTDIDTRLKLEDSIISRYNAKEQETTQASEKATLQSEHAELQRKVQLAEAALASARDAWKNAGPFKKIGMRIRGENNFSTLEKVVADTKDELTQFENQHTNSAAA